MKNFMFCLVFSLLLMISTPSHAGVPNLTGTWTSPQDFDVTFFHNVEKNSLNVRWPYFSKATGVLTLRGAGAIKTLNARNKEFSILVPIGNFQLIMNGRLCHTTKVQFRTAGKIVSNRFLQMSGCELSISYCCFRRCAPKEIVTTAIDCSGDWE